MISRMKSQQRNPWEKSRAIILLKAFSILLFNSDLLIEFRIWFANFFLEILISGAHRGVGRLEPYNVALKFKIHFNRNPNVYQR